MTTTKNAYPNQYHYISKDFKPDVISETVRIAIVDYAIRHGVKPNRITVFHEGHWNIIRDMCTERGILRVANKKLATVNDSNNIALGHVDHMTEEHLYQAEDVPTKPEQAAILPPEEDAYVPDAEAEEWGWSYELEDDTDVLVEGEYEEEEEEDDDGGVLPAEAGYSDAFLAFKEEEQEDGSYNLSLIFRNKPDVMYVYTDLLVETIEEFMESPSKGTYYNEQIAGQFERRVEAAPVLA